MTSIKVKQVAHMAVTLAVPVVLFFALANPLLVFTPNLFWWSEPSSGKLFVIIVAAAAILTVIIALPTLAVSWLVAKWLRLDINLTQWIS